MPESDLPDLYQNLAVMAAMLKSLPKAVAAPLLEQYQRLTNDILQLLAALVARDQLISTAVAEAKLDYTYISFDLEATRRERDRLRQQLEDNHD